MDDTTFDRLVSMVAQGLTRRAVLSAAVGAISLLWDGRSDAAARARCLAAGGTCRADAECCSGACDRRRRKRGRCRACPSGQRRCPEGVCRPAADCCLDEKPCNGGCIPVEECCGGCPNGQTCCPSPRVGQCADLRTDAFNCGVCTRQCPNPTVTHTCRDGACVPL